MFFLLMQNYCTAYVCDVDISFPVSFPVSQSAVYGKGTLHLARSSFRQIHNTIAILTDHTVQQI